MNEDIIEVATYERVSSDDQRERETIKTQSDAIDCYLESRPAVRIFKRYQDDGVSGTIPFEERPAGAELARDARRGRFREVWVTRPDRLGRKSVHILNAVELFDELGIGLVAILEPIEGPFMLQVKAAVAEEYRRTLLQNTALGMARAAKEGRYTGGIVPMGYRVEGERNTARLVPSDLIVWGDWTEADLVRRIYRWLAVHGWSCRRIAGELNQLGVPTAYVRDDRLIKEKGGYRKQRTQGLWRAGRIRNLVVNPVYRGELLYGRRSKKTRDIVSAPVRPLVTDEVWHCAQQTLAGNRVMAKVSKRRYLLRSLLVCGLDGLRYSGSFGRGFVWYRCNGQLVERGPSPTRCLGKSIKGPELERVIWNDVERFLRDPGPIIEELSCESETAALTAEIEADRSALEAAIRESANQRDRMLDLYRRNRLGLDELEQQLDLVELERRELDGRLSRLRVPDLPEPSIAGADLLPEIRRRLDDGLDDEQRDQIVHLLVRRITVHTDVSTRPKGARIVVEYNFPTVGLTCTGRGSSPLPA